MFDREPGFKLPDEKRLKTALLDRVQSTPIDRRMNDQEKKEWAKRRLERAHVIENLPEYREGKSDWNGEVPHNFIRHMREASFFDSIARKSHEFKGRRNQAWTVFETSITKTTRMIRFFTIRNQREVPFEFILQKSSKIPNSYDLTVKCGVKILNRDKMDTESKQFFASNRHLYDFVTTELWGHLDALPLLPVPVAPKRVVPAPFGNMRRISDQRRASNFRPFGSNDIRKNIQNSGNSMMSGRKNEQGYSGGNFNNPRPPLHNNTNFGNNSAGPRNNNNFGNNFPRNQPQSSNQFSGAFSKPNREPIRKENNNSFFQRNSNQQNCFSKPNQEPMKRENHSTSQHNSNNVGGAFPRSNQEPNRSSNNSRFPQNSNNAGSFCNQAPMRKENNKPGIRENSFVAQNTKKNEAWGEPGMSSNQNSGSTPKFGEGFGNRGFNGSRGGSFGNARNNAIHKPN